MKKRLVFTVILMVLVPILFFKLRDMGVFKMNGAKRQKRCWHQERALKESFKGEIMNKYEAKKNHNIRTIVVKDKAGGQQVSTILAIESSGIYHKLKVGDNISKETGKLQIVVEKDTIMLNYNCGE